VNGALSEDYGYRSEAASSVIYKGKHHGAQRMRHKDSGGMHGLFLGVAHGRQVPCNTTNLRAARLSISHSPGAVVQSTKCDKRGGREYNLALGQKRGDEKKERLILPGGRSARIETVSFGKEKPRALSHEEKCQAENRRADFVATWK
jgi:hypothetical protein